MHQKELVSILLPTFNSELFLEDCLKSILDQNYKNIELIIVDNESIDNTKSIIREYSKLLKILLFTYKTNNLAEALNFGISKCNGEFIARLDSDDLIRKYRIEKQVSFLKKNHQYFFVGTNALRFKKNIIFTKPFNIFFNNTNLKLNLLFQSSFIHPTIMFRKKSISHFNLYDNAMNECEDYDLWIRLMKNSKFKNLKYNGIYYRVHSNSASLKKKKILNNFFININSALLKKYNIYLNKEEYNFHIKISGLKISNNDNFDKLNSIYIKLLNLIKSNKIIQEQFNEKKINEFISKKYFRFCMRCINIKNFSIKKCLNSNFKFKKRLFIVLLLMKIIKLKI